MSEASTSLRHPSPSIGVLRLLGDDRLARLAADGNEHAFAAIYARHHQGLYRYCRSILVNDEDAKDALQNATVKALRALPGETRQIALKPWLYRIAHNEAISLLRRRGNDSPIEDLSELADNRTDGAETRERLRNLVADLRHLPDRQRSALVMRELNGLGYEEIGVALGSSPAAAKQSVYEAREALHELAEGREMECDAARQSISAGDRRILRGRRLRAHLRTCVDCRTFKQALHARPADLGALAPPMSAATATALLHGVLGGGGGGGVGGGLVGALGGAAGNTAAGSAAAKLTAATLTVAVGVGAYEAAREDGATRAGTAALAGGASAQPLGGVSRARGDSDAARGSDPGPGEGADEGETSGPQDRSGADSGPSSNGAGGQPSGTAGSPGAAPVGGGHPTRGGAASGHGDAPPGLGAEFPPARRGANPGLRRRAAPPRGETPPRPGKTSPGLKRGAAPPRGGAPPGLD